ncbi:MAG: hypothetical protein KJZ62_00060 [Fimbriimonadaceae bacterium]|nr:hypothetical protein [Fimbriimonadaceae bacterium]
MDANQEPSIFNISQLHAALGRLDLDEVAKRTIELAEDYMPGGAWLDANGEIHFAETMGEVQGLVLCQATEFDEDSPDEVPFWVASWLPKSASSNLGCRSSDGGLGFIGIGVNETWFRIGKSRRCRAR